MICLTSSSLTLKLQWFVCKYDFIRSVTFLELVNIYD